MMRSFRAVLFALVWTLVASRIQDASAATKYHHPSTISSPQKQQQKASAAWNNVPNGGGLIPAGYNPFGYKITALGEQFLKYEGSLDSDVGRLLSTLKSQRKTFKTLKDQWLEVVRVSKSGQNMRIYRLLQELVDFCLKAGLLD
jgi:hypothetical protein